MKPCGWKAPPLTDSLGRIRGARWRGRHVIPERAHPLVRRLIAIINQDGCTLEELAARAGVDSSTINSWRSRKSPQLVTFEALLNVLGWKLAIVPLDKSEAAD